MQVASLSAPLLHTRHPATAAAGVVFAAHASIRKLAHGHGFGGWRRALVGAEVRGKTQISVRAGGCEAQMPPSYQPCSRAPRASLHPHRPAETAALGTTTRWARAASCWAHCFWHLAGRALARAAGAAPASTSTTGQLTRDCSAAERQQTRPPLPRHPGGPAARQTSTTSGQPTLGQLRVSMMAALPSACPHPRPGGPAARQRRRTLGRRCCRSAGG